MFWEFMIMDLHSTTLKLSSHFKSKSPSKHNKVINLDSHHCSKLANSEKNAKTIFTLLQSIVFPFHFSFSCQNATLASFPWSLSKFWKFPTNNFWMSFSKSHTPEISSLVTVVTAPAPIKGAPLIKNFLFWPLHFHIKNA